jgi:hypothetical protein
MYAIFVFVRLAESRIYFDSKHVLFASGSWLPSHIRQFGHSVYHYTGCFHPILRVLCVCDEKYKLLTYPAALWIAAQMWCPTIVEHFFVSAHQVGQKKASTPKRVDGVVS